MLTADFIAMKYEALVKVKKSIIDISTNMNNIC